MIHRCQCCSGVDALKAFLDLKLFDFDNSKISFNQWKTNNRAELIRQSATADDFDEEMLCEDINKLTSHTCISKSQINYLKEMKEKLKKKESCITLLDFAENYVFVV